VSPLEYPRGAGPGLELFGRLAPGVTLAEAQAELTTLGRRAAADFPSTHRYLRPRVVPYATSVAPISTSELFLARTSYGFFLMLVVLICGNVALLLFARAATREGELAIRNALGASRGRIVAQLFAEALVLGGVAAAAALGAAGVGVRLLVGAFEMNSGSGSRSGITPTCRRGRCSTPRGSRCSARRSPACCRGSRSRGGCRRGSARPPQARGG
jgi:hypothetical protein